MNGPEVVVFPGSSNLSRARFEPDVENLMVEFLDGDVYTYFNVPPGVFRALTLAPSAGKYFHAHIRTRYAYEFGGDIDADAAAGAADQARA